MLRNAISMTCALWQSMHSRACSSLRRGLLSRDAGRPRSSESYGTRLVPAGTGLVTVGTSLVTVGTGLGGFWGQTP